MPFSFVVMPVGCFFIVHAVGDIGTNLFSSPTSASFSTLYTLTCHHHWPHLPTYLHLSCHLPHLHAAHCTRLPHYHTIRLPLSHLRPFVCSRGHAFCGHGTDTPATRTSPTLHTHHTTTPPMDSDGWWLPHSPTNDKHSMPPPVVAFLRACVDALQHRPDATATRVPGAGQTSYSLLPYPLPLPCLPWVGRKNDGKGLGKYDWKMAWQVGWHSLACRQ